MEESVIFEIFDGLPLQGPDSNECTRKAFDQLPSLLQDARILDIGCGLGTQTGHRNDNRILQKGKGNFQGTFG